MLGILNMILPSEHVFNGYFSNPNFVRRPRTKLKMWNFGYLCCFLTDFTQINTESKQNFIQSINSNNCFRLKSWIFILALAPSFPLLNYPFKNLQTKILYMTSSVNHHYLSLLWTKALVCAYLLTGYLVTIALHIFKQ